MNKHYKGALIEATVEHLQENCGVENVNRELLNTILDREEWTEDDPDSSFEGDLEYLTDTYLEEEEEEVVEEKTQEEVIQEAVDNLHVGFNFIPGIGFGYCKDEEDLAKMREFVRGGMTIVQMMGALMGM